jgi:SOS response regulatory protein OraA/RecX
MKEIKALNKEELNLAIDETVKKIRATNTEKERKPYQKVLNKLIKEYNKRGYGIWISK